MCAKHHVTYFLIFSSIVKHDDMCVGVSILFWPRCLSTNRTPLTRCSRQAPKSANPDGSCAPTNNNQKFSRVGFADKVVKSSPRQVRHHVCFHWGHDDFCLLRVSVRITFFFFFQNIYIPSNKHRTVLLCFTAHSLGGSVIYIHRHGKSWQLQGHTYRLKCFILRSHVQ